MFVLGLLISIILYILVEAGLIVLSSFYIWLPLLVVTAIFIIRLIAVIFVIVVLDRDSNIKINWK